MPVGAVVLAAGRSSRYRAAGGTRTTKLVDAFAGQPLVRHPVEAALAAGLQPVVVVTGHAADEVRAALAGLPALFAHNADYATGLASSLRAGLAALGEDVAAAVVMLGDMPLVDAAVVAALVDAARRSPDAQAIVPVTDGERGNPVLLRRALFDAAARLTGDEGARRLLRAPGVAVAELAWTGEAVRRDIDDPSGLVP